MKKLYAILITAFFTLCSVHAQDPTAKVQIGHNAADPLAQSLDIYLNDELYLDDFQFRTATEFRSVVAGAEVRIGIALATSLSASDIIVSFPFTFAADSRNVLMINGVISPSNFLTNPDPAAKPINITAARIADIRETGFIPSQVDVLMWHGVSDLGKLDLLDGGSTKLVEDIVYGFASDYFRVNGGTIPISVHIEADTKTETYRGDFGDYVGQAVVLIASGFYKPEFNEDGQPFGLYIMNAEGGPFDRLPPLNIGQVAYVQFVNNVADVDHGAFDIWVNDIRVADNLAFRKATQNIQVTPNTELTIAITDTNSATSSIAHVTMPFTFTSALHMIVINGLVTTDGYAVNLDPNAKPLGISMHHVHDLKPGTTPDHVEMFVMNGSTDAAALDFTVVDGPSAGPFFDDVSYGTATAYAPIAADAMKISVEPGGIWSMDLTSYPGKAIAMVTSGFANPVQNKNGAALGLLLVFDDGQTQLLENTSTGVHDNMLSASRSIYPNPTTSSATLTLDLAADAEVNIELYDAMGVRVAQSAMGLQTAGTVRTTLPCTSLSSGMYQVLIETGSGRTSIPLWIVR